MIARNDRLESTPKTLRNEPIEKMLPKEPIEPIEKAEPIDPMDMKDLWDAMDQVDWELDSRAFFEAMSKRVSKNGRIVNQERELANTSHYE